MRISDKDRAEWRATFRGESRSVFAVRFPWWLVLLLPLGMGSYMLWLSTRPGGLGESWVGAILPGLILLIPATILHEVGHLLAVRARGLSPTRLTLGDGFILKRWTLQNLEIVIGAIPMGGSVGYLTGGSTERRLDMAIVAAAGPAANLLAAAGAAWWSHAFASPIPGIVFADLVMATNLFMAVTNLCPFKVGAIFSDGWYILQALRTSGIRETKVEKAAPGESEPIPYGIEALSRYGARRRKNSRILNGILMLVLIGSLIWMWMRMHGSHALIPLTLLSLAFVCVSYEFICKIWFADPLEHVTPELKIAHSPRIHARLRAGSAIRGFIAPDWAEKLDPDLRKAMSLGIGISREWEIALQSAFKAEPDNLLVGLHLYDVLCDAGKPMEAISHIEELTRRFELPDAATKFLEGYQLGERLLLESGNHPAIKAPDLWLDGQDEPIACHWLFCLAITVLSSPDLAKLYPEALGWCDQALQIYPHDLEFLNVRAALLMEAGEFEQAEKLLLETKDLPAGSREGNFRLAFMALLGAKISRPNAHDELKKAARQDLAPWLARRITEALEKLEVGQAEENGSHQRDKTR